MKSIKSLPYFCKELINLYALDCYKNYEALQEFNKIADYEPCIYSHHLIEKCARKYKRLKGRFLHQRENMMCEYRKTTAIECAEYSMSKFFEREFMIQMEIAHKYNLKLISLETRFVANCSHCVKIPSHDIIGLSFLHECINILIYKDIENSYRRTKIFSFNDVKRVILTCLGNYHQMITAFTTNYRQKRRFKPIIIQSKYDIYSDLNALLTT